MKKKNKMIYGSKKRFSCFFLILFTAFSLFSLFLNVFHHFSPSFTVFCFYSFWQLFTLFSPYSTSFHHFQPFSPFSTVFAVLHRCYYPQTPRDSVFLACVFFCNPIWIVDAWGEITSNIYCYHFFFFLSRLVSNHHKMLVS